MGNENGGGSVIEGHTRFDGADDIYGEQIIAKPVHDAVNHPKHYTSHASGVECITITEHFGFNLGNVIKYLWRAEEKGAPIEDLKKAAWYLNREIQKREAK